MATLTVRIGLVGLLLSGTALASPMDGPANTAPSSSATPYLLPTQGGWTSTALLTTGDSVPLAGGAPGTYRMVGVPDGLGAFDNGNGTFTVLMNHEVGPTAGVTRGHGSPGAFVSQFVVDKNSLQVLSGRDLVNTPANMFTVNGAGQYVAGTTALARLCSADLPAMSAFYDAASGKGYNGHIFMNGEENGSSGRAFGWVVAEQSAYQLPKLGTFSHENSIANAKTGLKTVVFGTDDATPTGAAGDTAGRVYLYVGDKQATGTAVDKAGLTNGASYAIKVDGITTENRTTGVGIEKSLAGQGAGATVSLVANAADGTGFLRPEDAAWDTQNPNRVYFVTTDRYDQVKDGVGTQAGRSRLWAITLNDAANPTAGGKIEMLLDGTEAGNMFDNLTVSADGTILLQEDVGGQLHNGKIWTFDPRTGALTQVFQHDPARFGDIGRSATAPFNDDEESSGVVDVTALFSNAAWYTGGKVFLADVQAHYRIPGEPVEGGQLLLLTQVPEPGSSVLLLTGLAGLAVARRRSLG